MFIRRDEDDIDRIFRQRLKNAEEAFPGHLWEGIRQRSAPKRRILPFWIFAAVLVTGALGIGLYQYNAAPMPVQASNNLPVASEAVPTQTEKVNTENPDPGAASAALSTENTNPRAEVKEKTGAKPAADQTAIKVTPSETKENDVLAGGGAISAMSDKQAADSSEAIATHATADPNVPVMEKSSPFVETTGEESQVINSVLVSNTDTQTATTSVITEAAGQTTRDAAPVEDDQTSHPEPQEAMVHAEEAKSDDETNATLGQEDLKLPEPPASVSRSPFAIGAYVTLFEGYRQMSNSPQDNHGISDSESAHLAIPDQNARGIAFGLGAQYSLSRWFYVGAGLEYSDMKERSKYKDIYTVGTPTYVNQMDTSWFYTETDTALTIGMATVPSDSIWSTKENTAMIFNSYQSFNIPITAGFSWRYKNFLAGIETGPVLRIAKKYTGYFRYDDRLIASEATITPNPYDVPQIEEGKQIYLKEIYTDWNMDWQAALRLGYSFSPHFSAQGAIQYRLMKKPISYGDIGEHRFIMPGVSFGLYYRF